MLISIAANYLLALWIDKLNQNPAPRNLTNKKLVLAFAIIFNLGFIVFFKYLGFLTGVMDDFIPLPDSLLKFTDSIHLVAGISFYTFHSISYIVDIYWGQKPQKNLTSLALYISMFPQLIAGPIIRYHTISDQLSERKIKFDQIVLGIERFIIGLSKKVIIANTIATIVDPIFSLNPANITATTAWIGIIGYALQIYFDFSGYSDMAIGLGAMFGFKFPENFNYPYISQSITEFWRRWHMSLSAWFRDYVYIPLGGNRKGKIRNYINLVSIFVLCGLWHGASWNFLVWGLWHGAFLVIEKVGLLKVLEKFPSYIRTMYSMLIVLIGWVFFRADDLKFALKYIRTMFGLNPNTKYIQSIFISNDVYMAFFLGLLFAIPVIQMIRNVPHGKYSNTYIAKGFGSLVYKSAVITLLLLSILLITNNTYNPFIYYRF